MARAAAGGGHGHGQQDATLAAGQEQGRAARAAPDGGQAAPSDEKGIVDGEGGAETGQVAQDGRRGQAGGGKTQVGETGQEVEQTGFSGAVVAADPEQAEDRESRGEPGGEQVGGEELGGERGLGEGAGEIDEVIEDGDQAPKDIGGVGTAAVEVALEGRSGPEAVLGKEAVGGGQKAIAKGGYALEVRRGRCAIGIGAREVEQAVAIIADQDQLMVNGPSFATPAARVTAC